MRWPWAFLPLHLETSLAVLVSNFYYFVLFFFNRHYYFCAGQAHMYLCLQWAQVFSGWKDRVVSVWLNLITCNTIEVWATVLRWKREVDPIGTCRENTKQPSHLHQLLTLIHRQFKKLRQNVFRDTRWKYLERAQTGHHLKSHQGPDQKPHTNKTQAIK